MKKSIYLALGLAVLCVMGTATMYADVTLVITQSNFPQYNGEPIGPYAGTLNGAPTNLTCLDLFLETNVGVPYLGTLTAATTDPEREAVYLTTRNCY